MKKAKLFPLLGIGASCAALTPIMLTGCSVNSKVDLMEVYYPSIEKANKFDTDKNEKELTEWYYEAVAKNPQIYVQDFYYAHSVYTNYLIQTKTTSMIYSNACISNVSFSTITSSQGTVTPALSCDIQYNYSANPGSESGVDPEYQGLLFEGSFTFKFKNVPMRLCWYTDSNWIPGWATQIKTVKTADDSWVISEDYDNLWKITEDAKVNVIKEELVDGVYQKTITPFETKTSATTQAEYIANLGGQSSVTKLTLTDIVTSHYMAKLNEVGR